MDTKQSIAFLTSRLKSLRNYILFGDFSTGMTIVFTALAVAAVIAFLFNAAFFLSTTFRTVYLVVAGIILVLLISWRIIWRLVRCPSTEDVALDVENKNPQLKNRLIASLQLEKNLTENREGFSREMIQAVISQSEKICQQINFRESVDHSGLHRAMKYFAAAVVSVLLIWFLFPSIFSESVYLFSHPTVEIERVLSYELKVITQNEEVAKFSPVTIAAIVFGRDLPEKATLSWRYPGGKVKSLPLTPDGQSPRSVNLGVKLSQSDTTKFNHTVREVKKSFEYWITAGELQSPVYLVNAVDKPRVIGIKLTYHYPKYTGLTPLVVDENDGNISAIKGTRVKVEGYLNKPVTEALIVFSNNKTQKMEIGKQRVAATIEVMENGSYHIDVTDSIANKNVSPIEYRIQKIADLYPEVNIFSPGVPVDLDDEMALNLGVRLFDDFGFSRINLLYRLFSPTGEVFDQKTQIDFDKTQRDFELSYIWDLSNIGLEPGGYVEYLIEAFDNDAVSGPKRGLSQTLTARLPSLDEMFAYLDQESEQQVGELERLRDLQEDLAEQTKDLQEELLTNQSLDWEKRKEIEQSVNAQQDILDAMEKVAEQMQQLQNDMRKNQLTSLEILQKLEEIKKLFEEVATPEMREAIRKMQEALQNMDPEELRKAAEEMQMSQEELKERLERTIALLKFMQIQQKMENIMNALKNLIEQQGNVNEETSESSPEELPELTNKELQNREQFDDFQKMAKELEELFKEADLYNNQAAKNFCQAPSQSKAGDFMEDMAGSMTESKKDAALGEGEAALNALKKLQEEMNEQKDAFNSSMGMQSAEKMKEATNEILYVSDQQESVYGQCERVDPRSPQLGMMAAEQQALQRTLETLDSRLREISKESAFYQDEINNWIEKTREAMENSASCLTNRNGTAAMRSQKDAMHALNQAANKLMQSMQSQKSCSGGSCNKENMFKKMSQMSEMQKKINSKSAQMCQNPKPCKTGRQVMSRLAGEQSAVQKSMEQLQKEQGNRPDILGRLDELGHEVRKVVEDLEGGTVNEQTLRRQNKILSRMLDFQRSLERQDFSEERHAESGRNIMRKSPTELRFDSQVEKNSYQDRLQRYLRESFPEEYEELVKEYFRAVNNR